MAELDDVSEAMATLMPTIRTAFKAGANKTSLSEVLSVDLRESALNVRMPDPEWPAPGPDLVEPQGELEKVLRLCREKELHPAKANADVVAREFKAFGEATAIVYRNAVLTRLWDAATEAQPTSDEVPDAEKLSDLARPLGVPCRAVASRKVSEKLGKHTSASVDKVVEHTDWGGIRLLLVSLTAQGPWAEELDPEFVLKWQRGAGGKVQVRVSRRLYLHRLDAALRYEVP